MALGSTTLDGNRSLWRPVVGVAVAAVLSIALLAGACSDGGDSDGGTSSTEAEAPSTTTDATEAPQSEGVALARYEGSTSEIYADPANWVCHPAASDICDDGLDATVVEADGTLTVEPWQADPDAPVDCFYVYPTISRDPDTYSDRDHSDDEEGYTALNQVARLGEVCRVFAPVYRQRTLAGLVGGLGGSTTTTVAGAAAEPSPGQTDVNEAWRHYMATENRGRGVVLVGHSQGAGVLNQLIRDEIDPHDDVRELLVAAYLAGATVRVLAGEDVGGDFENVPLCRSADQTGCVVSWAAYRSTEPPTDGALFGRPRSGEGRAACNHPAALAGGSAELRSYFPTAAGASILAPATQDAASTEAWVDPAFGEITTPFVTAPGLVRGECVSRNGFDYLEVTVVGDPEDPRADDIGGDLSPAWGLHLVDINLVMGDMVDLVRSQSAAHLEAS